jgi:hypothetical protein
MAALLSAIAATLIFLPEKIPAWWRWPLFLSAFWLLCGWLAFPAVNTVRSSAAMMQKVASIAGDHPVAILQWKEQYLLFAPSTLKLTQFAYQTPPETEIIEAKQWLQQNNTRYLMLPNELLQNCQIDNSSAPIELGTYHRKQWWLVKDC